MSRFYFLLAQLVLLFLASAVLLSCDRRRDIPQLLELFEVEAAKFEIELDLRDFPVALLDLEGNVAGKCIYFGKGLMRGILISLDGQRWKKASSEERERVFFHEGGHCFLGQNHRIRSLMRAWPVTDYFARRSFYLEEMFLHGPD